MINTHAVMIGLVPVIHVLKAPEGFRLAGNGAAWMAGTSPAMTERAIWNGHSVRSCHARSGERGRYVCPLDGQAVALFSFKFQIFNFF
jgi:hypothetical protein